MGRQANVALGSTGAHCTSSTHLHPRDRYSTSNGMVCDMTAGFACCEGFCVVTACRCEQRHAPNGYTATNSSKCLCGYLHAQTHFQAKISFQIWPRQSV